MCIRDRPLFILAFPSIFIGYLSRDLFIGLGTGFWNNAIFVFPTNLNMIDAEFANQFFRLLPLAPFISIKLPLPVLLLVGISIFFSFFKYCEVRLEFFIIFL